MINIKSYRYSLLDQIRGFAVLLMIIFHFSYDLAIFGYADIDFSKDLFWWIFPRVIVFLFMISVGMSLRITHFPKLKREKLFKRILQIASLALLISISTYFMFPTKWVYFGTLHCIALCLALLIPFLKYPKLSLVLALSIIIPSMFQYNIPWFKMKHLSMDYIPIFPWIAVGMLGIYLHSINFHKLKAVSGKPGRLLSYLGRHSLLIYMVHQPILFSSVYIFNKIMSFNS